jgi:hypothetical protein
MNWNVVFDYIVIITGSTMVGSPFNSHWVAVGTCLIVLTLYHKDPDT